MTIWSFLSAQRFLLRRERVVLPGPLHDPRADLIAHAPGLLAAVGAEARGVPARGGEHAQLHRGTLLQHARSHGSRAHIGERRGDAVAAHHDGEARAQLAREQVAELARADEADALVLR